jgi:hypothetical protein
MAIRLKDRERLAPIERQRRNIPVEQIIRTKGFNPLAAGIETAGNVLAQAMQQRNTLKRKMRQNETIEKAYNLSPGELSGIEDIQTALSVGKYIAESRRPTVVNIIGDNGQERQITIPPGSRFGGNVKEPGISANARGTWVNEGRDPQSGLPVLRNNKTRQAVLGKMPEGVGQGALLPKQQKILTQGALQDIKNHESAISLLKNAQQTAPEIMARSVGLFGGKVAPALSKLPGVGKPFRDPERAVFQQNVKTGLLKFLYSEAGKQLSDPERINVEQAIGSVDTPIEEFKPKLDNAIQIIESAQRRYTQSLSGAGYTMSQPIGQVEQSPMESSGQWSSEKESRFQELMRRKQGR